MKWIGDFSREKRGSKYDIDGFWRKAKQPKKIIIVDNENDYSTLDIDNLGDLIE